MGLRRWSIVARRILLVLGLLVVLLSVGLRARTYLLTRKIHAVLAGLERIQIDKTSQAELLKTVPGVVLSWTRENGGRIYTVKIMSATDRYYYGWTLWVPEFLLHLGQEPSTTTKWNALGAPYKIAHILGWGYLSFGAD